MLSYHIMKRLCTTRRRAVSHTTMLQRGNSSMNSEYQYRLTRMISVQWRVPANRTTRLYGGRVITERFSDHLTYTAGNFQANSTSSPRQDR